MPATSSATTTSPRPSSSRCSTSPTGVKADRYASTAARRAGAVAVLFEKPSTRTRVSFRSASPSSAAIPLVIDAAGSQLGRGETIEDTARVLARYVAAIVFRTFGAGPDRGAGRGQRGCRWSTRSPTTSTPARCSPTCRRSASGAGGWPALTLAYVGDGATTWPTRCCSRGATAGMQVRVATPARATSPYPAVVGRGDADRRGDRRRGPVVSDPHEASAGADVLVTDVWVSMGQEAEAADRAAAVRAVPARRQADAAGRAATPSCCTACPRTAARRSRPRCIDGPQSAVWDQAENRLHAQKALLRWLLERS